MKERFYFLLKILMHLPWFIMNREVDLLCGYLCYTTLLSLIPLTTLFFVVGHWFGAHDRDTSLLANHLLDMLTPESAARVHSALIDLLQNAKLRRLGLTVALPMLVLLFSKLRMLRATLMSMVGEDRSVPWVFDLLLLVALLALVPLFFPMLQSAVLTQMPTLSFYKLKLSRLLLTFMAMGFFMRIFLPAGTAWSRQIVAAAFGALTVSVGNSLFTLLTTHVIQMHTLYGAFAAIPLFLIWLYVFWMTLILCTLLCTNRWLGLAVPFETQWER